MCAQLVDKCVRCVYSSVLRQAKTPDTCSEQCRDVVLDFWDRCEGTIATLPGGFIKVRQAFRDTRPGLQSYRRLKGAGTVVVISDRNG